MAATFFFQLFYKMSLSFREYGLGFHPFYEGNRFLATEFRSVLSPKVSLEIL